MKTARILLLQAMCGAAVGLLISLILAAIAVPSYSKIPIPVAMLPEVDKIAKLAPLLEHLNGLPLALVGFFIVLAAWCLTARVLNPHLPPFPYLSAPKPALAWTAVLLSGLAALIPQGGLPMSSGIVRFSGGGLPPFSLAPVLGGALCWLIISPRGWAGELLEWRVPWRVVARSWLRTAGLGAACGLLLSAGGQAIGHLFGFIFFLNLEVWNPADFITVSQTSTNFALPMALMAIAFAAAWSLTWALADDGAVLGERLKRATPGLCLAAAVGLASWGLYQNAVDEHDWAAGNLWAAAGLPDSSAVPLTLVCFGFDKRPLVSVKAWETSTRYGSVSNSGEVAATEANALRVLKFLQDRGRRSRFRNGAIDAVGKIYAALWRADKAFDALDSLQPATQVPFIYGMLERAWLANAAPITPENRVRLETLSDTKKYSIPGRPALTLARSWARFGDLSKAKDWLETARREGADKDDLAKFSLPAAPPLTGGVIAGRATAPGGRAHSVQVGLFSIPEGSQTASAPQAGAMTLTRIVASQWAGPDGSFQFGHLAQGRYFLSLLVSSELIAPSSQRVTNSKNPGIISLDRTHPRFDAGTLALSRP